MKNKKIFMLYAVNEFQGKIFYRVYTDIPFDPTIVKIARGTNFTETIEMLNGEVLDIQYTDIARFAEKTSVNQLKLKCEIEGDEAHFASRFNEKDVNGKAIEVMREITSEDWDKQVFEGAKLENEIE